MTLQYKAMGRTQAGIKGGGEKRYYAVATNRNLVDLNQVAEILSDRSTLSKADVFAVLIGLSDLIPELIMKGCSVKLDKVGIISAELQSIGKDTPEEVNRACIKELRLHFLPDKEIKQALRNCTFKRVSQKEK
jgi:predicted histone-like DNA-binding protein